MSQSNADKTKEDNLNKLISGIIIGVVIGFLLAWTICSSYIDSISGSKGMLFTNEGDQSFKSETTLFKDNSILTDIATNAYYPTLKAVGGVEISTYAQNNQRTFYLKDINDKVLCSQSIITSSDYGIDVNPTIDLNLNMTDTELAVSSIIDTNTYSKEKISKYFNDVMNQFQENCLDSYFNRYSWNNNKLNNKDFDTLFNAAFGYQLAQVGIDKFIPSKSMPNILVDVDKNGNLFENSDNILLLFEDESSYPLKNKDGHWNVNITNQTTLAQVHELFNSINVFFCKKYNALASENTLYKRLFSEHQGFEKSFLTNTKKNNTDKTKEN
jgi:hypothetical protein